MLSNHAQDGKSKTYGVSLFICHVEDILPNTGVCAIFCGQQVAIFRLEVPALNVNQEVSQFYALSNYDPMSKAHVISRGLIGETRGQYYVASPIYKDRFNLETGESLDHVGVRLKTYGVEVKNNCIYLIRE